MNLFSTDNLSALDAKEKAQWIAFAPAVFQATLALRNTGILKAVESSTAGLTLRQIADLTNIPFYGVRVLVEAGLGIGLMTEQDGVFKLTKTAVFILHDKLTEVNIDFMNDVCYQGMFHLEESIRNGKPEGLKVFGSWPTVYEALSSLPKKVQDSWFAFDHFYSDVSFSQALPLVFKNKPGSLLDIGGNTGKWALQCLEFDQDVKITIMDLPGQVGMAKPRIAEKGFADRVDFYECNVLDDTQRFPSGFDAIWMSQFLDCFSDDEIVSILRRCKLGLNGGGKVFILEPFWDRQKFRAAAFSLQQTSLYFTAMANGNSQMYHSDNFIRLIRESGFEVTEQADGIGISHTLLTCEPVKG